MHIEEGFVSNRTFLSLGVISEKCEEVAACKRDLRRKEETVQQRDIEISCLRGQVNALQRFCDDAAGGGGVVDPQLELEIQQLLYNDDDDDDSETLTGGCGGGDGSDHEDDVLLQDLEWDGTGTLTLTSPAPPPPLRQSSLSPSVAVDVIPPSPLPDQGNSFPQRCDSKISPFRLFPLHSTAPLEQQITAYHMAIYLF